VNAAVENFKDAVLVFRRDADAIVLHANTRMVSFIPASTRTLGRTPGATNLISVTQQVCNHLPQSGVGLSWRWPVEEILAQLGFNNFCARGGKSR
jgi:hypothetical protein